MGAGDLPSKPLRLVPVDEGNRADCIALRVTVEQLPLIASNAKSLRQAAVNPTLVPRVLLEGPQVVGFAMYQRRQDGSAYIWRVMVGAAHQGRGLGRRAMELLLEELCDAGIRTVFISHRPQNRVAAHLFEALGFAEQDFEPDGEVVRRLQLPDKAER